MKKYLIFIILVAIFVFGFILRIYRVVEIPPGFFVDEASIGYNAYTLIKSGEDEVGNKLPIFFKSFGNFYRPGVSVYLAAPFISIFGLNEFSLRLVSAIIGTITIIIIFYLSSLLFSSRGIGLLSALLLAVSPWHIHFSRIGQEFIYMTFFITTSVYFFLIGTIREKSNYLILSLILFGISLYTYVPAYFIVPLFLVYLTLIFAKDLFKNKITFMIAILIFFSIASPLLLGIKTQKTMSRFIQLKITNEGKSENEIINKMFKTYMDHFKPEFLFKKGDIGYHSHFITRFSVRGMGQLYWFQLPFIILGLIVAFRAYKKSFLVILGWLMVYPLPSTIVPFADGGGPFASRSIMGAIPLQILSALGIFWLFSLLKNKFAKVLTVIVCSCVILFSFANYLTKYFFNYPFYSADYWGWQYGPKEIIAYFEKVHNQYDELYMSGAFNSPDVFINFYSPNNCKKCKIGDLGKLNLYRKQLFALSPEEIKTDFSRLFIHKIIKYPNEKTAFIIFEVKKD